MMTGRCARDVKCIVLQELTIVAFVSVVFAAWTTTVLGKKIHPVCHLGSQLYIIHPWSKACVKTRPLKETK